MQTNIGEELKGLFSFVSLIFFHIFVLFVAILIVETFSLYFIKQLDFNTIINTIAIPGNIIAMFFIGFFAGRYLNWSDLYGKRS